MLVRTYTISKDEVRAGIKAADYESVVSGQDDVTSVRIHMVPVVHKDSNLSVDTAALSVSFLIAETGDCTGEGAVLSFDPDEWRLCSVDTHLILLDPCGETGRALIYAPSGSEAILVGLRDGTRYVRVSDEGVPEICTRQRSAMLLEALCPGASTPPGVRSLPPARESCTKTRGSGKRARKAAVRQEG